MTLQQARWVAVFKRVAGWVVFIPALISTIVSLLKLAHQQSTDSDKINAVIGDFINVVTEMIRVNTPFLNTFWNNSPVPDKLLGFEGHNLSFLLIYILMFVGLALSASGIRMSRQVKFIRENIEDQAIIENARESGKTPADLIAKIRIPNHTIFRQIFVLYVLPVFIGAIAWFLIKFLNW